ncbi:HEAT repeat domain-containing protein [Candidatus Uabimicrobium amorphum]|uniref:HEAT repeat domain-containing protein n=1 Tax=Uabimicrobium amorphum TaxID=2596890 RepID=A0A5S9F507_UABAM|nr:hypothetical protein [Candidatus Uabimicrobium amorphum]BBM85801.1 hypothetical protein UABAM_04179 [Candidatus Uabimicrobium amorphum]
MSDTKIPQKIKDLVTEIAASQNVFKRNIVVQLADENAALRYSAVWSVFTESVIDAAPIVIELLHDTNLEVRLAAIAVCGRLQLRMAAAQIQSLAQCARISEKYAAQQALEDIHYDSTTKRFTEIVCDDKNLQQKIQQLSAATTFHERTGKITSLVAHATPETLSLFQQLMQIPYTRLQCEIVKKLAKIPNAQAFLVDLLPQSSPTLRKELCNFYIKHNVNQAIPILIDLLQMENGDKNLLIETLGELNAHEAVTAIYNASNDNVAATALAKIYSENTIVPQFLADSGKEFQQLFLMTTINITRKREVKQEIEEKWLQWEQDPHIDLSSYVEKICGELTVKDIAMNEETCHVQFMTQIEKEIEFTSTSLIAVEGTIAFSVHHKPKVQWQKQETLKSVPLE